jgi:DNA-binding NarL/FixJ family response regulator
MSATRILVVDDFVPFRRFIISTLQAFPELQIVCAVSDGLEAVQKAEELQPHVILLDIGLPGQNGIEAARQIRRAAPASKIIFLSEESSSEVVEEALSVGARGYIAKASAGSELLDGVRAVIDNKQFLGSTLTHYDFTQLQESHQRRARGC